MIVYFGKDAQGFYADAEDGTRQYMPEEIWKEYIAAGAHAGADVGQERIKLRITEQATLHKFEGDQLVEIVHGTPDTTSI